jgi:hypothetical protein
MLFALSRRDPPVAPPKTGKAQRDINQQRQQIVNAKGESCLRLIVQGPKEREKKKTMGVGSINL